MPDEGHLIVRPPGWWVEKVLPTRQPGYDEMYRQFRAAIPFADPRSYRGMTRQPLGPAVPDETEDDWQRQGLDRPERRARSWLRDVLMRDRSWDSLTEQDVSDWELLPDLDIASSMARLLDEPELWEVIRVSRVELDRTPDTLGYDLGSWGGEFYSIIWDTAVLPTWHSPPPEDFAELAAQARSLNANVLFDSVRDALRFRDWYVSKKWAETDGFRPVRIESVQLPGGDRDPP